MSFHKALIQTIQTVPHNQILCSSRPTGQQFTARSILLCGEGFRTGEAEREENSILTGSGDFNQAGTNEKDPAFSQDG